MKLSTVNSPSRATLNKSLASSASLVAAICGFAKRRVGSLRVALCASAGVLFLLAGCGGSDSATGTLSTTQAACEIAERADRCTVPVAWTSQHATALQLQAPGGTSTSSVSAGGSADLAIAAGSGSALLIDGETVLASLSLSATCAARSVADAAGVCRPVVLHYTDKVYAVFVGYPFVVGTDDRARPLSNRTRFTLGEFTAACSLNDVPEASGRIRVVCNEKFSGEGPWHRLYIDPIEDALYEDPDESPADRSAVESYQRPPVPQALAAYVANGFYEDKGSGGMNGPYVTFGSRAGSSGPPVCDLPLPLGCRNIVPLDFYFFLAESSRAYYLTNAREGGLYVVPKDKPQPGSGTLPRWIDKDGHQGFPCRTCLRPIPSSIREYSHPG